MPYLLHRDCRHFRGDLPCKPHKIHGVICEGCSHYDPVNKRILIIKLAAVGDVVRTTPLLRRLRKDYPQAWISWLTQTPDVIPTRAAEADGVDEALRWGYDSSLVVEGTTWDWVILLDKDREACALVNGLKASKRSGFHLENGRPAPVNELALSKFLTGIDDKLNQANRLTYPQEIFKICGLEWNGEEYVLDPCREQALPEGIPQGKPLIGLNTGCAPRWSSRLWPEQHWIDLAIGLKKKGFGVLALGGPIEHEKNRRIAVASGASYLGHFPMRQFIRLVGECDVLVTAVTMAMHLAIGQQKRLVLFNNIFNRHEFELYGRGEILEPNPPCGCFFKAVCEHDSMSRITPAETLAAVERQVQAL
jgi:heptosyltransferase-2